MIFITAIIFGLLGSFHCLGMCGPIAFVLPLDRSTKARQAYQTFYYHIGRLLAYTSIGLLFGLLGKGLAISGLHQGLSIFLGISMILLVIIPAKTLNKYSFSAPIYRLLAKLKETMGLYLNKKTDKAIFSIGFLNGFLPCGMVYMALMGAMASGEFYHGGLYMFLFGLGTIPMMTLAVFSREIFSIKIRQRLQKAIPVFVVIIGLLFILRGMGLGIAYVSPKELNLQVQNEPIECVDLN